MNLRDIKLSTFLPTVVGFAVSCLIFFSCGKESPPVVTPDKPIPGKPTPEPPKSYASIGGTGGTLSWDKIEIIVPPSSFIAESTIQVSEKTEAAIMGVYEASKFYTISGIPLSFLAPIKLSIAHNAGVSGTLYMAVSYESRPMSLKKKVESIRIEEGSLLNGKYTVEIKPSGLTNLPADEKISITVGLIKDYLKTESQPQEYGTSNAHLQSNNAEQANAAPKNFKIYHPATFYPASLQLGKYLEEAFSFISGKNLKFNTSRRTVWPVQVVFTKLAAGTYGYFSPSKFGNNYGSMEFNTDLASNLPELRVTAAHELFHLAQALYDNRNAFSKAISPSPFYWMEEAASVWIETVFSKDSNYQSPVWFNNIDAPFKGIEEGALADAQEYGYGMSALAKYIVDTFGRASLVDIFAKEFEGAKSVLLAIDAALPTKLGYFYSDFIDLYLQGKVINSFPLSYGLTNSDGQFVCAKETDTLKTFVGSYPALSAKVYMFKPTYDKFTRMSTLTLTTKNESQKYVYELKAGKLTFLQATKGEYIYRDVKKLKEDKGVIIIMVVNNSYSRIDETLTAKVEIDRDMLLTHCMFQLYIPDALYWNDIKKKNTDQIFGMDTHAMEGTYKDGTFTATWSREYDNIFTTGKMIFVINEKERKIVSGEVELTESRDILGWYKNVQKVKLSNIYATEWGVNKASFKYNGAYICNSSYIYGIFDSHLSSTENLSYISHSSKDNPSLVIQFTYSN